MLDMVGGVCWERGCGWDNDVAADCGVIQWTHAMHEYTQTTFVCAPTTCLSILFIYA